MIYVADNEVMEAKSQNTDLSDITAAVASVRQRIPITKDIDYDGGINNLFSECLVSPKGGGKSQLRYDSKEPHLVALVLDCIGTSDPWGNARRLAKEFAQEYGIPIGTVPQGV
jgi:hypothetical protein